LTSAQAAVRDILGRLYRDYQRLRLNAPSVSPEERERLRAALGWFGDLVLAPQLPVVAVAGGLAGFVLEGDGAPQTAARKQVLAPAQRTAVAILGAFGSACLFGVAGLAGLIVFLVLVLKGKVSGNLRCGTGRGGVYAETFAVWLVLFAALGFAGALLPADWPRLPLGGVAMLLSLAALAWPVLRGVPWREVREDVGLTLGRRRAIEPWCGVCCYGFALPLLVVGVLLTLLLMLLERGLGGHGEVSFRPSGGPSHPIVEVVARADVLARLEVLFLACVVAPLVEETMFRGVLYRHLREATSRWGSVWSFLVSATVVSFLFAVIHPQGLIAVPVLMALAYGFAIAREWRGSLVGAMVGHGLNNGIVMVVTMLAMGD
jgi:membrane protease YdiL (CAAX protease family)